MPRRTTTHTPRSPSWLTPCSALSATSTELSTVSSTAHTRPTYRNRMSGGDMLLHLPPQTQHAMLQQINTTVDRVLRSMLGDHSSKVHWRPKGVKNDIAYYVDDSVHPDQSRFSCVGETNARPEDIINLFVLSDTETLRKHSRIMYNSVLDAHVISVLQKPTPQHPFQSVYLRYASHAAPKPMDARDLCLLVSTNVVTHDDGSTIGYCLWDSVELPECPDYPGLVRSRMFRSGFVCHSAANGEGATTTKIVYLVGMEPGGITTPKFAEWILMDQFGKIVSRLCNYFRRKHLDPATFRPRADWPSIKNAEQCRGCIKQFQSSFTLRHHCVACGEVFCRACTIKEQVDLPGVGLTSVRICRSCLHFRGLPAPAPCEDNAFSRAAQAMKHMSKIQRRRRSVRSVDAPELLDNAVYGSLSPRLPATPSSSSFSRSRGLLK